MSTDRLSQPLQACTGLRRPHDRNSPPTRCHLAESCARVVHSTDPMHGPPDTEVCGWFLHKHPDNSK